MVRLFFLGVWFWASVCQAQSVWVGKETAFTPTSPVYRLNIRVYGENGAPLASVKGQVEVYSFWPDGTETLDNQLFNTDTFHLILYPGRRYMLRTQVAGMLTQRARLDLNTGSCFVCAEGLKWQEKATQYHATGLTDIAAVMVMKPLKPQVLLGWQNTFMHSEKTPESMEVDPGIEDLATWMADNPGIQVSITAHTDCRGNDAYNLEYTQRCANRSQQQLIQLGIDAARIQAIGAGETQPAQACEECLKCPESTLALNRRTIFTIRQVDNTQTGPVQWLGKWSAIRNSPRVLPANSIPYPEIPSDYKGYAVELWRSQGPLSFNFPACPELGTVYQWKEPDGYFTYLLLVPGKKDHARQQWEQSSKPVYQLSQLVYIARNRKKYLN